VFASLKRAPNDLPPDRRPPGIAGAQTGIAGQVTLDLPASTSPPATSCARCPTFGEAGRPPTRRGRLAGARLAARARRRAFAGEQAQPRYALIANGRRQNCVAGIESRETIFSLAPAPRADNRTTASSG
jgi:hypothetical protein